MGYICCHSLVCSVVFCAIYKVLYSEAVSNLARLDNWSLFDGFLVPTCQLASNIKVNILIIAASLKISVDLTTEFSFVKFIETNLLLLLTTAPDSYLQINLSSDSTLAEDNIYTGIEQWAAADCACPPWDQGAQYSHQVVPLTKMAQQPPPAFVHGNIFRNLTSSFE